MKKIIFLSVFLIVPLLFIYSQDKKETPQTDLKQIEKIVKEVSCPDCMGWGWVVSVTYRLGREQALANTSRSYSNPTRDRSTVDLQQNRVRCGVCGGTGKVFMRVTPEL